MLYFDTINKSFKFIKWASLFLIFLPFLLAFFSENRDNALSLVLFFEMLFIPLFFLSVTLSAGAVWVASIFFNSLEKVDLGLALSPFFPGILLTALVSIVGMVGLPETFSLSFFFNRLWPHVILIGGAACLLGVWGGVMLIPKAFSESRQASREERRDQDLSFRLLKINMSLQLLAALAAFLLFFFLKDTYA